MYNKLGVFNNLIIFPPPCCWLIIEIIKKTVRVQFPLSSWSCISITIHLHSCSWFDKWVTDMLKRVESKLNCVLYATQAYVEGRGRGGSLVLSLFICLSLLTSLLKENIQISFDSSLSDRLKGQRERGEMGAGVGWQVNGLSASWHQRTSARVEKGSRVDTLHSPNSFPIRRRRNSSKDNWKFHLQKAVTFSYCISIFLGQKQSNKSPSSSQAQSQS